MSDHDALLAAVIAHPDEDTPRLVLADWFEESGQGERAEFIRAQVAAPGYQTWYNGAALVTTRADNLLRRNGHEWLGPYYEACNGRNWIWRRGFVEHVIATAADWLVRGDAVRRAQPVVRVKATAFTDADRSAIRARYEEKCGHPGDGMKFEWMLEEIWPGVTFELPAERFERGRIVTLPPDFLTRDYTEEGLQQMREAGRRAAEERERRNLETLLFNSTNPPR